MLRRNADYDDMMGSTNAATGGRYIGGVRKRKRKVGGARPVYGKTKRGVLSLARKLAGGRRASGVRKRRPKGGAYIGGCDMCGKMCIHCCKEEHSEHMPSAEKLEEVIEELQELENEELLNEPYGMGTLGGRRRRRVRGGAYIGGCAGCGYGCMHCGGSPLGGFPGEMSADFTTLPKNERRAARLKYLQEKIDEAKDQEEYDLWEDYRSNFTDRHKRKPGFVPKVRVKKGCDSAINEGLRVYCEWKEQHKGLTAMQRERAWKDSPEYLQIQNNKQKKRNSPEYKARQRAYQKARRARLKAKKMGDELGLHLEERGVLI